MRHLPCLLLLTFAFGYSQTLQSGCHRLEGCCVEARDGITCNCTTVHRHGDSVNGAIDARGVGGGGGDGVSNAADSLFRRGSVSCYVEACDGITSHLTTAMRHGDSVNGATDAKGK